MPTSKEFQVNTITTLISRWRYPLLASLIVCCVWWTTPDWNQYVHSSALGNTISTITGNSYAENGISLATFSTFTCDFDTLPGRVRMIRPPGENYWLFAHGFRDSVSDSNWDKGWEVDFANKLELYLRVIKELEPSRGVFLDLGANIGTHMLRMAAHGYETHAFEPTHANYVLTHCALAASKIKTPVRFNHFGLGSEARSVCIKSTPTNMGDSVVHVDYEDCEDAERADIGTLNHYYRSYLRGRKVAVMKIDVQGFEVIALEHGQELFDSEDAPEVVFFECEPSSLRAQGNSPADLLKILEERDYLMFRLNDGKVIQSNWSDAELVTDTQKYTDAVAIKTSWIKKAENGGYQFNGGIVGNL